MMRVIHRARRNHRLRFPGAWPICLAASLVVPPVAFSGPPPRLTARDLATRISNPKARVVSFVHRARNSVTMPLEELQVSVAIPRNDGRQEVHWVEFHPEPRQRTIDSWGQETAHFAIPRVAPGEEVEVRMTASVTLHDQRWLITDRDVGRRNEIPDLIDRHFLRNGENYRLEDEVVRQAAERIGKSGTLLEQVRRIHDFVMDSVDYVRDDRWESASRVLSAGKGSCSEYCYLMIALCRLRGIPARYAGGTWLAEDPSPVHVDRVFHRWVEVYLPRVGWFPVDPTQDDAADKEGDPYRFFGRVPWWYFTLMRGDGDPLDGGGLGWEYRSRMRWRGEDPESSEKVTVDRCAVWTDGERTARPVATAGN